MLIQFRKNNKGNWQTHSPSHKYIYGRLKHCGISCLVDSWPELLLWKLLHPALCVIVLLTILEMG